jgi:hypothetical protein
MAVKTIILRNFLYYYCWIEFVKRAIKGGHGFHSNFHEERVVIQCYYISPSRKQGYKQC